MKIDKDKLIIKQKVELMEIFSGFETKNKYEICDESDNGLYYAYEESGFWGRFFLKKSRALKLYIIDSQKQEVLRIEKKFAFFFPEFKVYNKENKLIASIECKFMLLGTRIEVKDSNNHLIYECIAKITHPWTFRVFMSHSLNRQEKTEQALISKKWSGIGKEFFSDADSFLVDFKYVFDDERKEIVLALAFAIDLFAFERKR